MALHQLMSVLKTSPAQGTWEDDSTAFQLSLGPRLPTLFNSPLFPYCTVVTVGTYGEDYQTAPCVCVVTLEPSCAVGAPLPVEEMLECALEKGFLADDGLQVFFIIHAGLQPQECLACGSEFCFNLVLHAWAFAKDVAGSSSFDAAPNITASVLLGIFDAHGVEPTHEDFGGGPLGPAPFDRLSSRTVHYHDLRFSPNNCQLQLSESATASVRSRRGAGGGSPGNAEPDLGRDRGDVATFFSLAIDKDTRQGVLTYHVVPVGDVPADWIRGWIRGRNTLGELLDGLRAHLPAVHGTLLGMIEAHHGLLSPPTPPTHAVEGLEARVAQGGAPSHESEAGQPSSAADPPADDAPLVIAHSVPSGRADGSEQGSSATARGASEGKDSPSPAGAPSTDSTTDAGAGTGATTTQRSLSWLQSFLGGAVI